METPNTVRLMLRNNIDERTAHRKNKASNKASNDALNGALNDALTDDEAVILSLVKSDNTVNQQEIAFQTGFSRRKVQRIIKKLTDEGIVWREGAKNNGKRCVDE